MFSDDLLISSLRYQVSRLNEILILIENDQRWQANRGCYSQRIQDIERSLRVIRKRDFDDVIAVF